MTDPNPLLLTRDQAAELLGTTERHVRRLVSAGLLTAVRLGGKQRLRRIDLDAFIADLPTIAPRPTRHPVDAVVPQAALSNDPPSDRSAGDGR
jgi:excisionase family DNA binding protein